MPGEGGPVADRPLPAEKAVGDSGFSLWHGDPEVIGRLVGGVIVDGVPGWRAVGLVGDERAVRVGHPAVERTGVVQGLAGRPGVADHDGEGSGALDGPAGVDGELLAITGERCRSPVHRQSADGETQQVQVEGVQRRGGPGLDGGDSGEVAGDVRGGRVLQVQVVVPDVVAAVAGEGEVVIADTVGPGYALARMPAGGLRRSGRKQAGSDGENRHQGKGSDGGSRSRHQTSPGGFQTIDRNLRACRLTAPGPSIPVQCPRLGRHSAGTGPAAGTTGAGVVGSDPPWSSRKGGY